MDLRRSRAHAHALGGALAVALGGLCGAFGCTGDLRFAGDAGALPDGSDPRIDASRDAALDGQDASSDADRVDSGAPGCGRDSDCRIPGLRCDVPSGVCVECVTDAHCSADAGWPRCDPQLHRCVPCQAPADCPWGGGPGGMTCEPVTRSCVATCADGGACPNPLRCDTGRGTCVECSSDAECFFPERSVCELATGRCVQCSSDTQCPAPRPRCDRTRGTCARCLVHADCPSGSECDVRTSTCVSLP